MKPVKTCWLRYTLRFKRPSLTENEDLWNYFYKVMSRQETARSNALCGELMRK